MSQLQSAQKKDQANSNIIQQQMQQQIIQQSQNPQIVGSTTAPTSQSQPNSGNRFSSRTNRRDREPSRSFLQDIYGPYYSGECSAETTQSRGLAECLANESIWKLYELVLENKAIHSWGDAIFYADKLVTLTEGLPPFVYLLGECYFLNTDYKKVHSLFAKFKLVTANSHFVVLAARALFKNKQYEQCLNLLDQAQEIQQQQNFPAGSPSFKHSSSSNVMNSSSSMKLEGQKYLLRGQCHEASENKQNAISAYLECLKRDPTCQEAFKRMVDYYLLGSTGKEQLLTSLNFKPEDIWIKQYYIARINEDTACHLDVLQSKSLMEEEGNNDGDKTSNEFNKISEITPETVYDSLLARNNIDLLCIKAKNCHAKYDIHKAYEICLKAIKMDPLYFDIIPVYCACLLHLDYLGELYYCAHNLVENYTTHPLTWFAIGTYYYLTKKYEIARKYFQKAIFLDRNFVYAWIGMAHSFAIQDESDQAMSFYRTVSRLFPGCYLAHLYMGMEYLRTNNLKTALLSFQYAKEINSNDPLIFNEIGVIFFKQEQYEEAKKMYVSALSLCKEATNSIVHTILNNLAHTHRKLKDFKAAIQNYEKCIQLDPKNYQTYFSLAFTYHISNQLNKAIAYYHKSLYYKHENQFAYDMLDRCLKDASEYPWETVYEPKNE